MKLGRKAATLFTSNFVEAERKTPALGGVFRFWGVGSPELADKTARIIRAVIGEAARNSLIRIDAKRLPPRFFCFPSFLWRVRARHSFGAVMPPAEQRAQRKAPDRGVAKRSTARLRAVAGASTLLGWGHGRRQNDLRRLLAALRMSAALAADRRRDRSP